MQDQRPQDDPNAIGVTEIIVPLGLSLLCGIGGFVWGLVRLAQGHKKPGWVAIGVNAATCVAGFVLFMALVGAGMAAGAGADASQTANATPLANADDDAPAANAEPDDAPPAPTRETIQVTAKQIFADYQANEIRANAKYQGKDILITGTVSGIDADIMDDPVVNLRAPGALLNVTLKDIDATAAANLSKGQHITARCTEVMEVMSSPILSDCALQ